MRPGAKLLLLAVTVLLAGIIAAPLASPAPNRCEECHSGSNPGGGYTFEAPEVRMACPSVLPPNYTANITFQLVHPGRYDIRQARGFLSLDGPGRLSAGSSPTVNLDRIFGAGGASEARWTITTSGESGLLHANLTFICNVHYKHVDGSLGDTGSWAFVDFCAINVRPVAVVPSVGELEFRSGKDRSLGFDVTALSEARNFSATPSTNLLGRVKLVSSGAGLLLPGQVLTVEVVLEGKGASIDNGRIDLSWENATGGRDSAFVTVSLLAPARTGANGADSLVRLTGRATGLLSLGLLVASLVIGLVKRGGRTRVRVHCAVSWFILGLSVYHGALLLVGPYSHIPWNAFILLGWVSAASMGVSSVNGLVSKWMSGKFGHRVWVNVHRAATILAVVVVTVHALQVGTDLKFLREALPGGRGGGKWVPVV